MSSNPHEGVDQQELRERAEAKLREVVLGELPPEEALKLYHELQVHQVELEFQNEELQRVHAELEISRERYFELYNLAPVGYLTLNSKGEILEANLKAAELLHTERRGLVGRRLAGYLATESLPKFQTYWKHLFETGLAQTWTLRVESKRCSGFWGRFEAAVVESTLGSQPACRMVMSDITAQFRAEQAARENEERLGFVLDTSKIGAWDLDLEKYVFYHSLEHDRIFGYSHALPKWTYDMFLCHLVPEDVPEINRGLHRAVAVHGVWNFECRIRRADGEIRWVAYAGRYRTDLPGGKKHMAGIVQDITERKQSEAALRQSEERFAAFMANLPGLAYIQNRQGDYVYSSGTSHSKINAFGGKHSVTQIWEETQAVFQKGTPFTRVYKVATPEGTQHWLLTRFPIKTANNDPDLLGAIALDITAQIQTAQRLETALKEETVLKREIHHRVKNSLQVVISLLYIQSLQIFDPTLREILRECQSRTRAIALIYALLSSENMASIPFSDYAKQLLTDLCTAYQGSSDRISLEVDAENIFIDVDTALPCGLILTELLSNSFKHAFPGDSTGEIRIQLHATGSGMLELTVRDNGVGPPSGINLESSQTVGLSLIRDLARQLGGVPQFEYPPGVKVSIKWPL